MEHLDTSYNCLLSLFLDTNDLYFIIQVKCTSLYTSGSNCTTACNREYVLYRHYERLICVTLRIRNIIVDGAHQLHDSVAPFAVRIFQSAQSGTLDDRAVSEFILFQLLGYFHLYQLDQLFVVNHITFVQEYNDIRYAYLTGQKDMLFCLSHNTVCSSYNKDSAVHLCSTSDHVLNVVSMSWAVNVCIVSVICLVLNVCGRNCNTTLSLFWSLINILKISSFVSGYSLSQYLCDSSGESCLTMIDMTNRTNVTMRFTSYILFLSHF